MFRTWHHLILLPLIVVSAGCSPDIREIDTYDPDAPVRLLSFSKMSGFDHDSVEPAIDALEEMARAEGWALTTTANAELFTEENLARYNVCLWLMTSGNTLDEQQEAAFQAWVRNGGAFVGVHSASATEYEWPWFGELVGAYFDEHPAIQDGAIDVADTAHPAAEHLPLRWQWRDEFYNFHSNPTDSVDVILWADESSYEGGTMGAQHPIAWSHVFEGARSFYTALGHRDAAWSDPLYLQHVRGGIRWAAGLGGPP